MVYEMAYSILLVVAAALMVFFAYLQGQKHWVKASINAALAVLFASAALFQLNNSHTTINPSATVFEGFQAPSFWGYALILFGTLIYFGSVIVWIRSKFNQG